MAFMASTLIVGGTGSIGLGIAKHRAKHGDHVTLTSRDAARAAHAARDVGGDVHGLALDLSSAHGIADALAQVGQVDHLILATAANDNSHNTLASFDIDAAIDAVTVKLVGFTETIRVMRDRLTPSASVVVFGGLARNRPYPGSTMVTTFNAGVSGLVRTLALELAPIQSMRFIPVLSGTAHGGAICPSTPRFSEHRCAASSPSPKLSTPPTSYSPIAACVRST